MPDAQNYTPRLRSHYDETIKAAMVEKFSYANPMMVPRLDKVVINMGVGEAVNDTKKVQNAVEALTLISGQKPVVTRAKKSIAGFKSDCPTHLQTVADISWSTCQRARVLPRVVGTVGCEF